MFLIGPILFLHHEESLVSSNLNSKLFKFHCVRPNVDPNKVFSAHHMVLICKSSGVLEMHISNEDVISKVGF